jgi:hypothetical protein
VWFATSHLLPLQQSQSGVCPSGPVPKEVLGTAICVILELPVLNKHIFFLLNFSHYLIVALTQPKVVLKIDF